MKIMFLSGSYWPAQDGVAHVTEYLAEGLAKKHEILMLTPLGKSDVRSEEYEGVSIERYQITRKNSTYMAGEKTKVIERIKEYHPDVLIVIGIQNWGFDWTKKILDRLPGKKILMTHGSSCLERYNVWNQIGKIRFHRQIVADLLEVYICWYWKRYQKAFPKYVKQFDLVTYLFDKEPLYLHMLDQGATNGAILENATEDFFFERRAFEVDPNKPICFINVSNYEERKDQKLLLEAYYEADVPDSELILIGSRKNDYYEQLVVLNEQLAAKEHKCSKAVLYVNIKREQVLELYKKADVYLAASKWEAMSISICEAAAAGLTIISTPVGHVSEVPGVFLFRNQKELVEIIGRISKDQSMREASGKESYEFAVKAYKIQNKVDELDCMINQIVEG